MYVPPDFECKQDGDEYTCALDMAPHTAMGCSLQANPCDPSYPYYVCSRTGGWPAWTKAGTQILTDAPPACGGVGTDDATAGRGLSLRDGTFAAQYGCLGLGGTGLSMGVGFHYETGKYTEVNPERDSCQNLLGEKDYPSAKSANLSDGWSVSYARKISEGTDSQTGARWITVVFENKRSYSFMAPASSTRYLQPGTTGQSAVFSVDEEYAYLRYRSGVVDIFKRANGTLVAEEDPFGNRIEITYPQPGVKLITNKRTGQWIKMIHAWQTWPMPTNYGKPVKYWKLTSVEDSTGRTMNVGYDSRGRVSSISLPADGNPAHWTFAYDGKSRLAVEQDPLGSQLSVTHMPQAVPTNPPQNPPLLLNRVSSQTRGDGVVSAAWIGTSLTVTYEDGNTQRFDHDLMGRVTAQCNLAAAGVCAVITYNNLGLPTSSCDAMGRCTAYTYQGELLTEITAPGNESVQLEYGTFNGMPRITRLIDEQGRGTGYDYDEQTGAPTAVLYPDGRGTLTARDAFGRVTSMVKRSGCQVTYTYDALGYPSSVNDCGLVTLFVHDARGNVLSSRGADGVGEKCSYRLDGLPLSCTQDSAGANATTTFTYDVMGHVRSTHASGTGTATSRTDTVVKVVTVAGDYLPESTTDASNTAYATQTQYVYSPSGTLLSMTSGGVTTSWSHQWGAGGETVTTTTASGSLTSVFDASGELSRSIDENGLETAYLRSAATGRLKMQMVGVGAGEQASLSQAYSFTHLPGGMVDTVTGPDGESIRYFYDPVDRMIEEHSQNGASATIAARYEYDADGRPTRYTHGPANGPPEEEWLTVYDDAGREVSTVTKGAGGQTISITRVYAELPSGGVGALDADTVSLSGTSYTSVLAEIDGNGVTQRTFAYDGMGRLVQTKEQGETFDYVYDALNCLVLQTGAGKTQLFSCDALGRTTSETMNGLTRTWTYDDKGRLLNSSDAAGTTTYGYDASGRVTQIAYPPATPTQPSAGTVHYGYNPAGRVTQMNDMEGTTTYTYDALGRFASRARQDAGETANHPLTYGYTLHGTRLASMQYWSRGSVNFGYDPAGRMTSLTDWSGRTQTFGYTPAGRLSSVDVGAGGAILKKTRTYDGFGRLSTIEATRGGATVLRLAYPQYDNNHNILQMIETVGAASFTTTYGYDPLNRLMSASLPSYVSLGGPGAATQAFAHDAAGNLKLLRGTSYTHDGGNRIADPRFVHGASGNLIRIWH